MFAEAVMVIYIPDLKDIHVYSFAVLNLRKVFSGWRNTRFFNEAQPFSRKTSGPIQFPALSKFPTAQITIHRWRDEK
jgi:hypothetical protein